MPKRDIVRVVLSKQQREILEVIASKLGMSESEALRVALMDYAKELNIVTEKVHGRV